MNYDSENDEFCTPTDILEVGKDNAIINLPEKSRKKYEAVYKTFMDWRSLKNINSFSESVLLTYFEELGEKYKSSSLWGFYSMLRSTLTINEGVNIESYTKLRAFLKLKSEGYQAKKTKTFTPIEINKFINDAPDNIYLATKVALIMGIMGACRAHELHSMNIEDVQDLGSAFLVKVPITKTKIVRKFTITDHFYEICKRYIDLRPTKVASASFFLNYQNGKCTVQNIGINKFGAMGRQIAKFLKLPDPEMYSGHSFRRSSATLLVDASGDITALKRRSRSRWKSSSVAAYIDNSMSYRMDTPEKDSVKNLPNFTQKTSTTNENINFDVSSTPSVNFTNCSKITINFVTNQCDCDK